MRVLIPGWYEVMREHAAQGAPTVRWREVGEATAARTAGDEGLDVEF
jgi:hypothetical protein